MGRGSGSSIAIPKQLWHGGLSQITIGRRDFDSDAIRAEFPKSTPLDPPRPQINPEELYSHSGPCVFRHDLRKVNDDRYILTGSYVIKRQDELTLPRREIWEKG